jgi:hypothetical protein
MELKNYKIYVFIDLREQIRQKGKGFRAC